MKKLRKIIKFGEKTIKKFKFPVEGSQEVEFKEWVNLSLESIKELAGEGEDYSNFKKISSSIQNPNIDELLKILVKVRKMLEET